MIKHQTQGVSGRLSYYDSETRQEAGYLSYALEHRIVLRAEHTVVDEAFQGQGIARLLVEELVSLCRRRGYILRPLCSYVALLCERIPQWADLLEEYDGSTAVVRMLNTQANPEKAQILQRYFKTAPGEYAAGDVFLGITVPQMRMMLRQAQPWTLGTIRALAQSELHEARWLAFVALAERAKMASSPTWREELYRLYLSLADRCNNWDLVDSSCRTLAGEYWLTLAPMERRKEVLRLANVSHLWTQRIAVVGTYALIVHGFYDEAIEVVLALREHPHDLIHKASGWMLREIGKRAPAVLRQVLDDYASMLPRTALRYAIERMSPDERAYYLALGK